MSEILPPCASAALEYIERGLMVLPLKPGDKVPAVKRGVYDASDNPEQARFWWGVGEYAGKPGANPSYNVGMACGQVSGGVIVIDVDKHGDVDGRDTLKDWETAHGGLPETACQLTGGGGLQYFYRVSREIKPSVNGTLGIDIRGDGSYAVMPPSLHPSGEYYEWSVSFDDCDIADADDNVYALIDFVRPTHVDAYGHKPLFHMPDIIDKDRNNTLFGFLSSAREKGMDNDSIRILAFGMNNSRCKPPMDDAEVNKIINSVCRYEPGNKLKQKAEDNEEKKDTEGKPKPVEVKAELMGMDIEKADKLKDVTSMDVLAMLSSNDVLSRGIKFDVHERRPWKMDVIPGDATDEQRPIDDNDMANIWGYTEQAYGIRNRGTFDNAFMQFVTLPSQRLDRLMDAMAALPTVERAEGGGITVDGDLAAPRAGFLLTEYLGCEATEYVYEAERLLLRQVVARSMFPGCKADVMPILTGAQGIGKSTFVEKLALDTRLYLSSFSKFDEEHKRRLAGKLIVEVGELDAFGRSDMSAIKEALTDKYDETRAPYARFTNKVPRTCVFIGTTNEGRFLTDTTGNRRFLPIECGRSICEPHPGIFDGSLDRDIRQAYAETILELKEQGKEAFLASLRLPANVQQEAMEVQEEFEQEDSVLTDVQDYLDSLPMIQDRVNVKMVMTKGFGYSDFDFSRAQRYTRNDVARALDRARGWKKMKGKQLIKGFGTSQTWRRA